MKIEVMETADLKIPRWAITIIVLLISNMVVGGFAAGKIVQRVDNVDSNQFNYDAAMNKRMDRLEDRMYDLEFSVSRQK
jgi:hypothetical protein